MNILYMLCEIIVSHNNSQYVIKSKLNLKLQIHIKVYHGSAA